MVTVKMLKPYYIKADEDYVRVILAYQYFAVLIHDNLYHFIPVEAKEIRINRITRKVDNIEANFAFQKGKDIIHIPMTKLLSLSDFVSELDKIVEPYKKIISNTNTKHEAESIPDNENVIIINELERLNLKRLIDKALDERDENAFRSLTQLL